MKPDKAKELAEAVKNIPAVQEIRTAMLATDKKLSDSMHQPGAQMDVAIAIYDVHAGNQRDELKLALQEADKKASPDTIKAAATLIARQVEEQRMKMPGQADDTSKQMDSVIQMHINTAYVEDLSAPMRTPLPAQPQAAPRKLPPMSRA